MPESPGVGGAKGLTPVSDGLVRDLDAPLGEEIFGVAETQAETVVEPDSVTDDHERESIAVVAGRLASSVYSASRPLNLTIPSLEFRRGFDPVDGRVSAQHRFKAGRARG